MRSLFRSKSYAGIYIHGSVGSGKTILSRAFFEQAKCKKMFLHYQDFMRLVHRRINFFNNLDRENIIAKLAKDYASKTKLLCLDEFEIKDIVNPPIGGDHRQAVCRSYKTQSFYSHHD